MQTKLEELSLADLKVVADMAKALFEQEDEEMNQELSQEKFTGKNIKDWTRFADLELAARRLIEERVKLITFEIKNEPT